MIVAKTRKNLSSHHIIPRSRVREDGGRKNDDIEFIMSEFNEFRWTVRSHRAWHALFQNLTLFEVWDIIDYVHGVIFCEKPHDNVAQLWLAGATQRNIYNRKNRNISVKKLRERWTECFDSDDIVAAKTLMGKMMLVMIFGARVRRPTFYLDTNYVEAAINGHSRGVHEWRVRAFDILFGKNRGTSYVKKKIAKLLNHSSSLQ
ncbi:MAG: hypothetical protein A2568_03820 [Candidatus Yanofskybacteria bacterium RIFOXYD1_FULL_44_17]|nr:MAG: hypothetical protein A2241_01085 [Candidatus Yanofskybacteria bacterium RIFOXYA2_FULL_45_28]OGN38077.1 MAG: hypothetical protein A2302_02535 [Candidatus Yanofskybacteria bacterium RIFOXYB2_FULL_44_18]OGN38834.1 MAG: hypothetical protein A2371_03800 [Candidatus Yanofskybacteria bacterium RIFOXYB1_FULL_44_29]OGN39699.1 MAG: hypothetical protein A2568_03820 [Candidatus Yanofskybacteria bacterium RIFOXYD1_FULL_44_17]HBX58575.1 hypothetical protein [Candidatus Yanofskybacteria bacterium]